MKSKLVLVGNGWKRDPKLIETVDYINEEGGDFLKALSIICADCIPDFLNWGPSEAYHQDSDYATPLSGHGLGITICFSQLYKKDDRRIEELTQRSFDLVLETLALFGLTKIQVFAETHVSNESGDSLFIEAGPKFT